MVEATTNVQNEGQIATIPSNNSTVPGCVTVSIAFQGEIVPPCIQEETKEENLRFTKTEAIFELFDNINISEMTL